MNILSKAVTILYIVIGVYFIYSGIFKRGRFFENPNVKKENMDEFKKVMVVFLICSGIFLIAGAIFELLKFGQLYYKGSYVAVLVFAMILLAKLKKLTGRG